MKLKIGTGTSKTKKKEPARKDDYLSELSDKELEAMQIEADGEINNGLIDQIIQTEVEEIVEEEISKVTSKDEEEELKDAVKGVFILDEVGINIKYAERYAKLFPKKRVVYRNYFTKAFLKWYITNANNSMLKDLFVIESDYVKPEQKDEVMRWITKRMKAPVELEDVGTLASPKLIEVPDTLEDPMALELTSELETKMYEFLLSEKWGKEGEERMKGIIQLDNMLEEQMRLGKCDTSRALENVILGFHLTSKFDKFELSEKKLINTTEGIMTEEEFIEEHEAIFSGELNKGSNAEKGRELDRSIKRFHHIKFLYELMGTKMEFTKDLTREEFKHIGTIDHLLNDREELKIVEKAEKTKRGVKYGKLIR